MMHLIKKSIKKKIRIDLIKNSESNGFSKTDLNGARILEDSMQTNQFYELTEPDPDSGRKNSSKDVVNPPLDIEFTDPDIICGFGKFHPPWLQKYATARNYLILFSIVGVLQGSYMTYLIGILTTLEKRYAFKSQVSGTIMMIDEITPLFLGVLVGYFGGRMHRPRILALGMYASAFCCFLSALPYFLYGPSQTLTINIFKNETINEEYCDMSGNVENCADDHRPPTVAAVACLIIGSFFKGFGNLSYYAVGLSYMDDIAKKKNTPLYFATAEAFRLCGPILGFLLSSAFLKYYEDPLSEPGYGTEDPRWIGAWWLGFVLQGALLSIVSTPLILFPKRLPTQRMRAFSNTRNFEQENSKERIMGMFRALGRVVINPVYVLFSVGTILGIIGGYGLFILIPKYMEIQFGVSASEASLVSGPPALVGMQITIFIGGWLIWKWKPTAKQLLIGNGLMELVWAIGIFLLMIPSCEQFNMPGTKKTPNGLDIINSCNADCSCSSRLYLPVCGPDGHSLYFSPCHAGCVAKQSNNSVIDNCKCVFDENGNVIKPAASVTSGACKSNTCYGQKLAYLILFPFLSSLTCFYIVAHTMILLRCVAPEDKSIALGFFEALISALGFLPFPIIFGALSDSTCLVWESGCGSTGNCWLYDVQQFKYLIHGFGGVVVALGAFCFLALGFMHKRIHNLYDDPEFQDNRKPSVEPKENQVKA